MKTKKIVLGNSNVHRRGRPGIARRSKNNPDGCLWPSQVALDLMLTNILSLLLKSGCERKHLIAKLRGHADRIESGISIRKRRSPNYELMVEVSGLVHDWCWEAPYTNSGNAQPRALRLDGGEHSLRALIRRRLPDRKVEDVLAWMETYGVIARQPDGSFALTHRLVLIGDYEAVVLERITTLAAQYLETALNNLRSKDNRHRNLDRTARVYNLPERFLPQFREMVEAQTQSFLESIDIWLESRNAPNANEATVEAAVHSYSYTGAPKRKRMRRMAPERSSPSIGTSLPKVSAPSG
jgi:hypothetical protein